MNILGGTEVHINCRHLNHVQQRVQFSPIISLREFKKIKLYYLQNISMKFSENFATAAAYHFLLLIVPIEFLMILNVYGSE